MVRMLSPTLFLLVPRQSRAIFQCVKCYIYSGSSGNTNYGQNTYPDNSNGGNHIPVKPTNNYHNPQTENGKNEDKNSPPKTINGNSGSPSENGNTSEGYNPSSGNNSTNTSNNGYGYNPPTGSNNNDPNTPPNNGNNSDSHNPHNNNGSSILPSDNGGEGQSTSKHKDCECVPFFLCGDDNTIAEDGVGLLDLRSTDECGKYDERCCEKKYIRPSGKPSSPKLPNKTCGVRNVDGVGVRITGAQDSEAQYAEFPWMVAVVQPHPTQVQDGKPVNIYQCGGSLIHPQVVLTGAHCVIGKDNLVIRAGEWDTQTNNKLHPIQDRPVQKVIIHEQFNNKSVINDPALLILSSPVDTSVENVGLICLPEENENMDGRNCVASGWGKDKFGKEGKYQVILKKVEISTVPKGPCLEALRKTRLGANFKLHESFICAGGKPEKDTCKGDGGSPLACPSRGDPEVYVQAGIVAWGINCGTEAPGVYVNVPYFVSWINNKLHQRGISL